MGLFSDIAPVLGGIGGFAVGGPAGAAAGASIGGAISTNATNMEMNEANNSANAQLAYENRMWQQQMSNTAHQREVSDLKAAGLNPILSATGGGGASTPSGSVATMQASHVEDVLGKGVSTALQAANLKKDTEMAESQKALNASSVQTQQSQQDLNTSSAMKTRQDAIKTAQSNNINEPAVALMRDAAVQQASADLKKATMDNKMATYDAINNRVQNTLDTANSAKSLMNPFGGLLGPGKNIPPAGEVFKNRKGETGFYDKSGKFRTTD